MNNKLYSVAFLCTGAAIGAVATWFLAKKHFEKQTQEEVESVKEFYAEKEAVDSVNENFESIRFRQPDEKKHVTEEKPDIMSYYASVIAKEAYDIPRDDDAYVIGPDEYGEIPDYEPITLTYYSDGVLADENNEMIDEEDAAESVGTDFMNHFGEYEEDVVYVRNDIRRCDYEILRDVRTYEESSELMPRQVEVE